MDKTELNKIINEMMKLYKQGKIEELIKIRDNKNESGEKRMAADVLLQAPKDTRKY